MNEYTSEMVALTSRGSIIVMKKEECNAEMMDKMGITMIYASATFFVQHIEEMEKRIAELEE